jgi:WD40 repeat protein
MVEELRSFATSVSALTFSPSGDRLAAGSAVSKVLVRDLSDLVLTR